MEFAHAGEFYSALCALLWAFAVILFRKSGERVAPVALNLFKDSFGLGMFLVTMPIIGVALVPDERTWGDWLTLLLSGAIGIGIADSLFFASLNRLGAGRSAIVDCLYSPFIILCSVIYLAEPLGINLFLAIGLMVGAIIVGSWQPEKAATASELRGLRIGVALGILSMLFMAVGIVVAKPVLNVSNPWWSTSVRLMGGVGFLAIQGLLPRYRGEVVRCFRPSRIWLVTVPAAVVGVYLAMLFWIMGMTYTETTTASVLNQLSTIFVLILATLFLKEALTWRKVVAIAMGFAGGIIVVL
jgi:drug/metabolite transporter (DMT)-like permease